MNVQNIHNNNINNNNEEREKITRGCLLLTHTLSLCCYQTRKKIERLLKLNHLCSEHVHVLCAKGYRSLYVQFCVIDEFAMVGTCVSVCVLISSIGQYFYGRALYFFHCFFAINL